MQEVGRSGYEPPSHGRPGLAYLLGPSSTLLNGLVHYWPLDETSGARYDVVGTAHLTDYNTVGYAAGKHNNAASFVAANSERLSKASFTFPAVFTWDGWIYRSSAASADTMFLSCGVWAAGVHLRGREADGKWDYLVGNGDGYSLQTTPGAITDDAWHFVVITFDSSFVARLYVDNSTAIVGTALTGVPTTNATMYLGFNTSFNDYLEGKMDESALWSRVLTTDERAELFAAGAGKFYPFA